MVVQPQRAGISSRENRAELSRSKSGSDWLAFPEIKSRPPDSILTLLHCRYVLDIRIQVDKINGSTIRIDDDFWRALKAKAEPLEDTPNDVMRRVLGLDSRHAAHDLENASADHNADRKHHDNFNPGMDYSGMRISGYRWEGGSRTVRTFRDLLITLADDLEQRHGSDFQRAALDLKGRKRTYFSRSDAGLKLPVELKGRSIWIETNLNANLIVGICKVLLKKLGHDPNALVILDQDDEM
jgi:negative regulator of replication initiation